MAMRQLVTTGRIEHGRLTVRNWAAVQAMVKRARDGEVRITFERLHATRSRNQNAYWWGVCVQLVSDHTGYTPEEIHELAKQMFLPKRVSVARANGEIVGEYVLGGSTTVLDVEEFSEFMERFRQWAAEQLDVVIPDPL